MSLNCLKIKVKLRDLNNQHELKIIDLLIVFTSDINELLLVCYIDDIELELNNRISTKQWRIVTIIRKEKKLKKKMRKKVPINNQDYHFSIIQVQLNQIYKERGH